VHWQNQGKLDAVLFDEELDPELESDQGAQSSGYGWGRLDGKCCELQAENFSKTLWKFSNRHFQLFSGDFVWGFCEGVLIEKLLAYK
jgi:hypothetical protein